MPAFIRLTDEDGDPVWVNLDNVETIRTGLGDVTHITFSESAGSISLLKVTERPDEIIKMLSGDGGRPQWGAV